MAKDAVVDAPIGLPENLGFLIADFGHPQWPGWQLILAALALTLFFSAVNAQADPLMRPARTPRPPARVSQTVRTAPSPTIGLRAARATGARAPGNANAVRTTQHKGPIQ